jgi:hydrogenase maturation factor HypF (carbamoyltransferase family)
MLALYRQIFAFTPEVIAVDAHAGYLSTQLGEAMAAECGARLVRVGHHHAHMAACMADNGVREGMSRCWASCSMVSGWGTMAPCGAARFWWAAIAMRSGSMGWLPCR